MKNDIFSIVRFPVYTKPIQADYSSMCGSKSFQRIVRELYNLGRQHETQRMYTVYGALGSLLSAIMSQRLLYFTLNMDEMQALMDSNPAFKDLTRMELIYEPSYWHWVVGFCSKFAIVKESASDPYNSYEIRCEVIGPLATEIENAIEELGIDLAEVRDRQATAAGFEEIAPIPAKPKSNRWGNKKVSKESKENGYPTAEESKADLEVEVTPKSPKVFRSKPVGP